MTPTISKVFLDSSVLIEAVKGSKIALLEKLLAGDQYECYINTIVVSEFMFHFLAVNAEVAPLTLKMQRKVPDILRQNSSYKMLGYFNFIDADSTITETVPMLMQQYNLLPNDAIIVATCKFHGLTHLATYDSELKDVCFSEAIILLDE